MHELHGYTEKDEYNFYIKYFESNQVYKENLIKKYAEGARLQKLIENYFSIMKNEIIKKISRDRLEINRKFLENITKIKEVKQEQGDMHKNGHCVSKIVLYNDEVIFYKPHSLDKNINYQNLYKYLCLKTKISFREVKYISKRLYGWEENVRNNSCNTQKEVIGYYFRMGIHLCLGYVLGATDLHGENIIAHGEYPVIIDMETYPGFIPHFDRSSTKDKAETSLREKIVTSVMRTGMLPVLTWGRGNNRVLISAMNMNGKNTDAL